MWYRRIDKNLIVGETEHHETDDNMEGAIVSHPRSSHNHYGYIENALKVVSYAVYARHKDKRIFWRKGDDILLPNAPHWAYRFIDVYRHGAIAYAETLTESSTDKMHSRGWDWSTCELLWLLDERKQAEMLKEVEKLKKNGLKGKKADILKNLVDKAFEHDLMWLDLEMNGECLDNDEFLEQMGMTFEEWEEEH